LDRARWLGTGSLDLLWMFPRLILDLAAWSPGAKVGSPDSRALVPRSVALEYDVGVFDSGLKSA
jgi:hypothetical protein